MLNSIVRQNYFNIQLCINDDARQIMHYVMSYIVCNILKIMGIEVDFDEQSRMMYGSCEMDIHETFVYPCVMKALGMTWKNEEIRRFSFRKMGGQMDFASFIREYVEWCRYSKSSL